MATLVPKIRRVVLLCTSWCRDPFLVCKELLHSTHGRSRLVREGQRPGPATECGNALTVTMTETEFVQDPGAVHEVTFRLQRQPNGGWLPVEMGCLER